MYVMYIYAQIYSSCWSRCVRKCLLTCAWKFYFIYVLWSSIPFHRKPCIFKSLWNWIDCSHPLWVDHPFLNHEPDDGAIGSKPTTKWTVYKLRLKENVHSTISPGFMTLERDSWERFHRIHRIHPGLLRHGVSDVRDSHKSNLQQTVVAFRPIRPMALKKWPWPDYGLLSPVKKRLNLTKSCVATPTAKACLFANEFGDANWSWLGDHP